MYLISSDELDEDKVELDMVSSFNGTGIWGNMTLQGRAVLDLFNIITTYKKGSFLKTVLKYISKFLPHVPDLHRRMNFLFDSYDPLRHYFYFVKRRP